MTPRTAKIGWKSVHVLSPRVPLRAGALGLVAGLASACVSIHDGWWGDAKQACFDNYEDCMDDIEGPEDAAACETVLDACLEACDGDTNDAADSDDGNEDPREDGDSGRADDGDDDPPRADEDGGGDGDGDGDDDPPRADEGGDGDGDGDGDTTGDGDGDEPDPACFAIHATCVAEAQTLQDIEACEALFDNCIDPGPCETDDCEPGCPQEQLDACVNGYADCAAAALTAEQVLACAAEFDGCVAEFDVSLCLPNYDDDLLLECLDQHDLCIACAGEPDEIAACKTAFDNCLEI